MSRKEPEEFRSGGSDDQSHDGVPGQDDGWGSLGSWKEEYGGKRGREWSEKEERSLELMSVHRTVLLESGRRLNRRPRGSQVFLRCSLEGVEGVTPYG